MTRAADGSRRYLACVFPRLAVERLRGTRAHLFAGRAAAPIALVEQGRGGARIAALDRLASAAGLTPGMPLADARKRLPQVEVFPHDPHADLDWLDALADDYLRYAPCVALEPSDALLVELPGDGAAGASEHAMLSDAEARATRRGLEARHACGDTPAIALALARHAGGPAPDAQGAMRRLPLAALDLDEEATARLTTAGCRTVGDVVARPPAALSAQFGPDVAAAAKRLFGAASPDRIRPHRRTPHMSTERRLGDPLVRKDAVAALLADLAAESLAALAARGEAGRVWEALFFRSEGRVERVLLDRGAATTDGEALLRMLRKRSGLVAGREGAPGIDLVRLNVLQAEPIGGGELALRTERAEERPPSPRATRATTGVPVVAAPAPPQPAPMLPGVAVESAETPVALWSDEADAALRPIHLFDPPQPLDAVTAVPIGEPPRRFRWHRRTHDVARACGPERITDVPGADRAATRDYYRLEDRRGRRFWVFRSVERGGAKPRWYVHGLFA